MPDNVSARGDWKNSLEVYRDDVAPSTKGKQAVKKKHIPGVFLMESDDEE